MAGWKDTNITNPGTSIKYGADDEEMVMRMFNGVTTGINPVEIKSQNKWGFWDNIMYIRNQADTFNTTIRGAATLTNNWTLAMPSQTANDTLPAIGVANIWGVKQQFDAGMLLKQQSAPPNPASTFNHFYTGTNGHLIRRNSTGAEFDYDVSQNGLPAGVNEEVQFNNNGVFGTESGFYYDVSSNELNVPGLVVNEDFLLANSITPPQITTDQNNYSPSGWNNATTLRLTSDTARNITGIGNQGDGTLLFIHNVGSFNITLKDESTSSTDINRFAFPSDVVLSPDNTATIKYDGITNRWRLVSASTTSSGLAQLAVSNVFTESQTIQKDASSDVFYMYRATNVVDSFIDCNFDFNDSLGNRDTYADIRTRLKINTSGSETAEMDINTIIAGIKAARLRIRNDGNFQCGPNLRINFLETGLTGFNDYTFPDMDTKLAGVGENNVFTDIQTIQANLSNLLDLYKTSSTQYDEVRLGYFAQDSTAAKTLYAAMSAEFMDTTDGSEDGQIDFDVVRAGTLQRVMKLAEDGALRIGRDTNNMRGVISAYFTSTESNTWSNTVSEQTIFSYTVKGNTVGVDGQVVVNLAGYLTQNQATGTTYTIRIKVGGVTWWSDNIGGTIGQDADSRIWRCELCFYPANWSATNGRLDGHFMMNDTSLPITGLGAASDDEVHVNANIRSSGTNAWGSGFGSDTTISVTVQMSVQSSSVSFTRERQNVVLIPS